MFRLSLLTAVLFLFLTLAGNTQAQPPSPDELPEATSSLATPQGTTVVLLVGADTSTQTNVGRSDVLMLAVINSLSGTVSFLSIPRDLYVALPNQTVGRINTAWSVGELQAAGQGPLALMETIRYNLGIQIDYWARVDFADFRQLIDDLGGVDLIVDCAIRDWRLIAPELDPAIEENWEQFTLPTGIHHMDGNLALWYVRSRHTSSDFDRGRRQQAVLQAIWRRIRSLGLETQITAVWPQLLDLVDTNMPVEQLIELLPTGLALNPAQITHWTLHNGVEVRSWRSPEGSSVLAPNRDALMATVEQFLTPPTPNQIASRTITVEIVNASGYGPMDDVAAWRLGWEGIASVIAEPAPRALEYTRLIDLAGQSKSSLRDVLSRTLNLDESAVSVEPDSARSADFRLIIGQDFYPCTYNSAFAISTESP